MSAPIGPGDWVECIDAGAPAWAFARPFCVVELVDGPACPFCGDSAPGVGLDDMRLKEDVYCTRCQVRPIYRPKSEIINSLLQPAPEREFEDA